MFKIRVEQQSEEQRKRQEQIAENWSFRVRKIRRTIRGKITKVYLGRRYDVLVPGREYPYERVPTDGGCYLKVGQVVDVGFMEDNPGIPFILCRVRDINGPRLLVSPEFANFGTYWLRFGSRLIDRNYFESLDSNEGSEVWDRRGAARDGSEPFAAFVRSVGLRLFYTSGGSLSERNDETGELDATELGSAIYDLTCTVAGRTYAVVEGPAYGDGGTGEAYDAGLYRSVEESPDPYVYGYDACDLAYGYDAEGDYVAYGWEASNPAPSPYNDGDTLEQAWFDGLYAGWVQAYRAGYSDAGCTPPGEGE